MSDHVLGPIEDMCSTCTVCGKTFSAMDLVLTPMGFASPLRLAWDDRLGCQAPKLVHGLLVVDRRGRR